MVEQAAAELESVNCVLSVYVLLKHQSTAFLQRRRGDIRDVKKNHRFRQQNGGPFCRVQHELCPPLQMWVNPRRSTKGQQENDTARLQNSIESTSASLFLDRGLITHLNGGG